jgi:TonB family protein
MRYFRILILIYVSFLLHGALALALWLLTPDLDMNVPAKNNYVDLLESPELRRRPKQIKKDGFVVKEAEAPQELLTDEKKETDLASAEEQNVIQEMVASRSGPTVNRGGQDDPAKQGQARRSGSRKLEINPSRSLRQMAAEEAVLAGDIDAGRTTEKKASNEGRPLDFTRFGGLAKGASTFGGGVEHDVRIGDFTALNTERHLFYTFFSRVEDGVRSRWVNYVKAVTYGIENGTERITALKSKWTTTVEILLDETGTFERAILHESSGSRGLDAAGVQAFRDAVQFPNPPPEMVKEDGKIHLVFIFNVHYIPQVARFKDAPLPEEAEN